MFYRRFFELAPETRSLFPNDLERQYLTLMDMMAAIIGALDKQELFQSITNYAGLRHARFGAKPAHFSAFGDALIWSLEQQLGASFTPDLRAAWLTLYDAVRNKMITAAERVA
jgi:hemoglobin-like flavoprotein